MSSRVAGPDCKCPFCEGTFVVLEDPQGVAHSTPVCVTFWRLDALEFLRAVNRQTLRLN